MSETRDARAIVPDDRIDSNHYRRRCDDANAAMQSGDYREVLAIATDQIRNLLPWLGFVGLNAMADDKKETYARIVRTVQASVEWVEAANEALATPPDPWTRRPKGGWTAETLPEHCGVTRRLSA